MNPPIGLFSADVSLGARLLGCLLWHSAAGNDGEVNTVYVERKVLCVQLSVCRETNDRHFRELNAAGWIGVQRSRRPSGIIGHTMTCLYQSPCHKAHLAMVQGDSI